MCILPRSVVGLWDRLHSTPPTSLSRHTETSTFQTNDLIRTLKTSQHRTSDVDTLSDAASEAEAQTRFGVGSRMGCMRLGMSQIGLGLEIEADVARPSIWDRAYRLASTGDDERDFVLEVMRCEESVVGLEGGGRNQASEERVGKAERQNGVVVCGV